MDSDELYQEVLLQHSKRPRNHGTLENATHRADGHNALCGDEISVALRVEDGKIIETKFTTSACAICTASASLMTETVKGLTCTEAADKATAFRHLAKTGESNGLPRSLEVLGTVHRFPQRVKCAVLPWETLVSSLTSNRP
jgi:nitrogen fixation NifU-like protein